MGLEVVVNEILARGSQEEQQIVREAETERQRMLDAAEGEADETRSRILQDTRNKLDALRREQVSASEFEARRRLLNTQRELTEDFQARTLHALAALPKADRERILSPLAKKIKDQLEGGRIHARKDDLAFLTKTTGLKAGHELQTAGGFQAESEDGTVLLDHRFETLLENAWKPILAQTRKLFEA